MTCRTADDFDAIRARLDEIRQERDQPPTCTATGAACVQACAVDDKGTVFCKKAADGGISGFVYFEIV